MNLNTYEENLIKYIENNNIQATHLIFNESCHSAEEAAKAANVEVENIVKSICFVDKNNDLIVAILSGNDKLSVPNVKNALNIPRPRTATEEEILEKTGYVCGGVPSLGYEAKFLIDEKVMEKDEILMGGGSPRSLVKISPKELIRMNNGIIAKITKE